MPQSPFKLFEAYSADDRHLFFGREAEISSLYNLLQLTRLVLLYGASGTGKTSFLRAGLPQAYELSDWFGISVSRRDDLNASLRAELSHWTAAPVAELAAGIQSIYNTRWIPICLIFDQFEEIFTRGNHEERLQFFSDLQQLLEQPLPLKIILSMREEYIGHLYDYEPLAPSLFENRFRMESMKDDTVRSVIMRTCEAHDIVLEEGRNTADQILHQAKGVEEKKAVYLPNLQVYLHYLYENAAEKPGNIAFGSQTLEAVGAVGNAVKRFMETRLDEASRYFSDQGLPADFAVRLLDEFATADGTKQARRAGELARALDVTPKTVEGALQYFSEQKLLRADENEVERFEPVHDVVARQIHELRSPEDKEFLAFVRQLENDYQRWAGAPSDERLLPSADLAKIDAYALRLNRYKPYTGQWSAYVEKSRAYHTILARKKRRIQQWIIVAAFAGFGLAALSTLFYLKANAATEEANAARQKAETALRIKKETDIKQFIIKAEQLLFFHDTLDAIENLENAYSIDTTRKDILNRKNDLIRRK